jgi:hypothetical protein
MSSHCGGLDGLQRGIEAVRFGLAGANEFLYEGDGLMLQGPGTGLVVSAAPGWKFIYNIGRDRHIAVRQFNPAKVLQITVRVEDQLTEQIVRQMAQNFKSLVEIKEI